MASAGSNHLTAEEVYQSICYSSRFRHRISDFSILAKFLKVKRGTFYLMDTKWPEMTWVGSGHAPGMFLKFRCSEVQFHVFWRSLSPERSMK